MTDDHVAINRDYWDGMADDWVAAGAHAWATDTLSWGNFRVPEADLHILPERMDGLSAVELGCGTGYVSAWMARRGARVTGFDISSEQLTTARRLATEHNADIAFVEANAETLPVPDASFDFAISEYGAAIWCDPDLWIPEAHRVLKPGGSLAFLGSHPLTLIASPLSGAPLEPVFHRPYRGMSRIDWRDVEIEPGGVEFNRTFEGWLALFRRTGFAVVNYHELYAPDAASGVAHSIPADWAKSFPSEQIWVLKKI